MKRIKRLVIMFMLITPVLSFPKLPTIPNISGSVTLSEGAKDSARKAGSEAAKNLNIDRSKIQIRLNTAP